VNAGKKAASERAEQQQHGEGKEGNPNALSTSLFEDEYGELVSIEELECSNESDKKAKVDDREEYDGWDLVNCHLSAGGARPSLHEVLFHPVVRKGGYVIEVQIHPEQPVHRVVLVSSFNASANEEDSPTLLVAFQTLHLTCNVDIIELPAPGALPPPAARLLCSPQPGVAMDSEDPVGGRLTGCQLTGVGSSGWPAHWVFLSIHGYASSMAGSGTQLK
jgi:hypothetical protein